VVGVIGSGREKKGKRQTEQARKMKGEKEEL